MNDPRPSEKKNQGNAHWKRVEPTLVSNVGGRTVVSKTFEMPGGARHHFETLWPEDCICVASIALTPDNKVIVARQFRPGPERFMNEVPGGILRQGEMPEEAARRELLWEVGYAAGSMEYLGLAGRDGYTNALWHYYLATDCKPAEEARRPEAVERIEVLLRSIDDFIADARSYHMTDPAAVLLAYEKLIERKGK
jgi:ADP-ribose pyrophosphatase